jgi:hypothetical protein
MPGTKPIALGGAKDFARLFDAEALGATFMHLAVDVTRGEATDFTSHWYRARRGEADLVIWTDGARRIIKHQLCFFGQVVEWTAIHGTRTGFLFEEHADSEAGEGVEDDSFMPSAAALGTGFDEAESDAVSEMIRFDSQIQGTAVQQAIQILSRVPSLSDEDRSALIFNLRQSPRMHKNARERALKIWAPRVDDLHSDRRPTFWRRLRTWILGAE